MKCQKILNLLNESSSCKLVTRKQNIIDDQSNKNYSVGNEIICSTEVLKCKLRDYSDAYIQVRGDITIIGRNRVTQVALKNCASFTKCITKIDGTTIDDTEDLDLAMAIYNFTEHSSNYSDTVVSLWIYSKDKATNFNADIVNIDPFKSFKYKETNNQKLFKVFSTGFERSMYWNEYKTKREHQNTPNECRCFL